VSHATAKTTPGLSLARHMFVARFRMTTEDGTFVASSTQSWLDPELQPSV
jgi:hypothetical protein